MMKSLIKLNCSAISEAGQKAELRDITMEEIWERYPETDFL